MKINRWSLFQKLFFIFTSFLVISFFVAFLLIDNTLQQAQLKRNVEVLTKHLDYLANQSDRNSAGFLRQYAALLGIRITLINFDGTVRFDSDNDPAKMENHLGRFEVSAAIREHGKVQIAKRFSHTLQLDMLYAAKAMPDLVLRVALPMENLEKQVRYILGRLLVIYALVFIVIIVIVYKLTRNVMNPLKNLIASSEAFLQEYHIPTLPIKSQDDIEILTQSFNDLRKQIAQNIEQLNKMENMRKEFIANVSHELKTPLTSIMGFIETLEAGALEDPKYNRHFLQIMKENAQRLHYLVEDILNLAKIENAQTPTELVDLAMVLTELLQELDLVHHPRIKLSLDAGKFIVNGNKNELYSAMLNYVDNALKYCQEGLVEISLKKEVDTIFFAVKDQGAGIASEHLARLFERFYRPDKTRSRGTGGTGLGLAIVKHVVEKHGGQVSVKSELGQGSEFGFWLRGVI